MQVLKKFHKKIFSLTDFIKTLAKTAQKRLSKYICSSKFTNHLNL